MSNNNSSSSSIAMTTKKSSSSSSNNRVILPSHLVPVRYDLSIQPLFDTVQFVGKIDIVFRIATTTSTTDRHHSTSSTRTTNTSSSPPPAPPLQPVVADNSLFDPKHEIVLHAKELLFESASCKVLIPNSNNNNDGDVSSTNNTNKMLDHSNNAMMMIPMQIYPVDCIIVNQQSTTVKFIFTNEIPIHMSSYQIQLTIQYMGFLNNQMAGFYRCYYTNIHGETKIMASTQFEALDARRAFPCIDEPAVKAIFGLTLIVPSHYMCCSNMPESNITTLTQQDVLVITTTTVTTTNPNSIGNVDDDDDTMCQWKRVQFLDTPIMSTYLLAFCVGEFDSIQGQTKQYGGTMINVYTPIGKSICGQFALDCAIRVLDLYSDFFHIPYPLPKLDMIAVSEFAYNAMENWGCLIYGEVDLLIDPVTASNQQKQRVATIVAHEVAHQWFGNLVTMAWWDDLWLNEGFASWAENWATDILYPTYRMWDQFLIGPWSSALRLDALKSSHPIQVPIHHAEEVEQVFDNISYCKGACVVRMIQAVIGMKNFQTGLRNYMNKYAYSNAETFHLWDAWEEASQMPIGEMMGSWTTQMGCPLVSVIKEVWHDDKVILEVEQQWFLSDGSELDEQDKAKKWTIPILTCTETGTQADMTLMRERTVTITVPLSDAGSWVKLNARQEVPMRVRPGPEMLKRFGMGIKNKTMTAVDRAGVLNDSYALVKTGKVTPETLIKLLLNYNEEDDYIVWESLSDVLSGLDSIMSEDDALSTNLKAFARGIVLKLMNKVGWESMESDGHLTTLLRGITVNLLSTFAHDDETVSKEALARFKAFQVDPLDVKNLPTDMRAPIFKIVLKNGGAKEYQEIKDYFYSTTDNAEREYVLNSLGLTLDPYLKRATMDWSLSGDIKLQDLFYIMGSVGRSNKEGREISWKFYKENFAKINKLILNANPVLMDACLLMCVGSFATDMAADEVEAFFQLNPLPKSSRRISQIVESIRTNAKLFHLIKSSALHQSAFWQSL